MSLANRVSLQIRPAPVAFVARMSVPTSGAPSVVVGEIKVGDGARAFGALLRTTE
jgi:hypothetical protein